MQRDIKGIGSSKINDILSKLPNQEKESVNEELIDLLTKKLRTDFHVIEAYCEDFMCELADDMK